MATNMLDRVTNGRQQMPQIEPRDEAAENMIRSLYANRKKLEELQAENAELRSALETERAARKIAENREAVSSMKLEAVRDIVTEQRRADLSALQQHVDEINNGREVYDTEERR